MPTTLALIIICIETSYLQFGCGITVYFMLGRVEIHTIFNFWINLLVIKKALVKMLACVERCNMMLSFTLGMTISVVINLQYNCSIGRIYNI